jgi:hypothetical protein
MKKTDLFTLLQLGPLKDGEIMFRYMDNYVVAKMQAIQYNVEAGGLTTFTVEGIVFND